MLFLSKGKFCFLSVWMMACSDASFTVPDGSALPAQLTCTERFGEGARSTCLKPTHSPEYYVTLSKQYYDTLDRTRVMPRPPQYASQVIRWEWSPWFKLTALGRDQLVAFNEFLADAVDVTMQHPIECKAFAVQPFSRCHMLFEHQQLLCPTYAEFTFNDDGEITFVEGWSDLPGLRPSTNASDRWAESPEAHRLSTKVAGLGNAKGNVDFTAEWMLAAAENDAEVADLVTRAKDFWSAYSREFVTGADSFWSKACVPVSSTTVR